ncbi:MAG: RNA polymerase subunit sigma-70 [Bacteroidetes bacterium MedPE-SWsnd-G2]|nr:MAG: RNA polymerase subunit sigma-70 [Bacteroidetes bacterium MedPE-SWsnd-G2]
MSLDQLIKKCKKQDAKAQSQVYQLFAKKLFSLCLKYSRNYAEAEDNLQDAFVTIFNKIDQFQFKGSFEGWAKRITINTALQRYKTKGVFNIVNEDQLADEEEVELEGDDIPLDFLLEIIQNLPDKYRLVFNLYVLDDYSHKEISGLLEISTGTSKSNLSRARQILKQKVEDYKKGMNSQIL